jgi:hypothetical protein
MEEFWIKSGCGLKAFVPDCCKGGWGSGAAVKIVAGEDQ